MPAINLRETRRAANPASKYDGVNSFEEYRTPVAYTADQLMRKMVEREAENQVPEDESARRPSYMDDMLAGAMPGLQSVDYEQYKPKGQYSYGERLAMLKNSTPENRMGILEMTAPKTKRMKKGLGAVWEALSPALMGGFDYANKNKAAYEHMLTEGKRAAAAEQSKQARDMEKEYLKGLLKKEANAEKLAAQAAMAEKKASAARYAADRAYEGKKFSKAGAGAHGDDEKDRYKNVLLSTKALLEQDENEDSSKGYIKQYAESWLPGKSQTNTALQEDLDSKGLLIKDIQGKVYNANTDAAKNALIYPSANKSKEQNISILNNLLKLEGLDPIKKNVNNPYEKVADKYSSLGKSKFDDSGTVKMTDPSGKTWEVKADKVSLYKQNGFK